MINVEAVVGTIRTLEVRVTIEIIGIDLLDILNRLKYFIALLKALLLV